MVSLRVLGRGNYAYLTARVKAKKALLTPSAEWPRLVARDSNEIARFLQENQYREAVDALAGSYRGGTLVERATRLQQGRVYRSLLSNSTGEAQALLAGYLERFDVQNLKALLRGVRFGATRDDVLGALTPVGTMPEEWWREMLAHGELDMGPFEDTHYGRLAAELAESAQSDVEDALDRLYYKRLAELFHPSVSGGDELRRYLQAEVDVVLLQAALRARRGNRDSAALGMGRVVTAEFYQRILRSSENELLGILENTPWSDLNEPWAAAARGGSMSALVTGLEKWLVTRSQAFAHKAPLSFLPIIDYILRLDIEVRNLRTIALGKDLKLTDDEIRELLLVVSG